MFWFCSMVVYLFPFFKYFDFLFPQDRYLNYIIGGATVLLVCVSTSSTLFHV